MENFKVTVINVNGILVTTSNKVAEELGVNHKHLLDKIDEYVEKFTKAESSALVKEFYIPSFYKVEGNFKEYRNYLITKKGIAQLVGGYSAAVEKAFDLNVAYINRFEEMEQILRNKNDSEWLLTREQGKMIRRKETDAIQELILYAKEQGSEHYNRLYVVYSKLVNKLVGAEPNSRDTMEYAKLMTIHQLENMFSKIITDCINKKIYYKEIYNICKERGTQFIALINYDLPLLEKVS